MSKTSIKERNKAIRLAWEREQQLVQEGKGTRDWTEEQQKDILDPDKGKAYDDNGRAYEGQHMKSAAEYPEYQGDPDNIQFLTREEHLEAHKGSWQNPTNWYYDSATKQFVDFGEEGLIPCKIIELSSPVIAIDVCHMDTEADLLEQTEKDQSPSTDLPIMDPKRPVVISSPVPKTAQKQPINQGSKGTVIENLKNVANAIKIFSDKHPVLTTVAEVGLGLTVAVVTGKAINTKVKVKPSNTQSNSLFANQTIKAATKAVVDAVSKFDFKKSESNLKQLGYTVAKSIGLSDIDRRKILQDAISNGLMSKEEICDFLQNNINLHKNQSTFTQAIDKWMADLIYIRDEL